MFSFQLACLLSMQITLILHGVYGVDYSTLGVTTGWMGNMGLTEIPTNIPCELAGNLDFRENSITRIEVTSFTCLSLVTKLDIGYNNITFIAQGAFDPLISMEVIRLRGNEYLPELPPHYGPNTANMRHLYIQHMNLQTIPSNSYFRQMPMLQELATSIDLSNDFFDGWTDLQVLFSYGNLAPNFTDRTPNVKRIEIKQAVSTRNMPNENAVGLTNLRTFTMVSCDTLPMLEGAVNLQTLGATSCQITNLPDYRHLVSLQTFTPDTSKFYCDTQSCWVLFETITNGALASVVDNIVCHGPIKFHGRILLELSPVQLRCFGGWYNLANSMHANDLATFRAMTLTVMLKSWSINISMKALFEKGSPFANSSKTGIESSASNIVSWFRCCS